MKNSFKVVQPIATCISTILFFLPAALAQEKDASLKVFPSVMYAPSAMPDRIILTWTGDPKTTQAVTWRTSTVVKQGLAEIAIAGDGPDFAKGSKQIKSTSQLLKTDLNSAHFHTANFVGLKADTRYAYRVGDGTNWSEWFHFQTAAESGPFSFIYFGDAQNDLRSRWSRVIREAYRDAPKAAFIIHAGDLVNKAESDQEWGEWFGAGAWVNAMTPSVAVPGNHERVRRKEGPKPWVSHHWRPSFAFPEHSPKGLEETCYTFVYNNMRIVALNSNDDIEIQGNWLEEVLKKNKSQWVVCTYHHPVFSTGKNRDNPKVRAIWKPIFDKYKVDLALQGHDHTYGRTGFEVPSADTIFPTKKKKGQELKNVPIGIKKIDKDAGTVYVVSVSGVKMYNNSAFPFMKRIAEDTQLYQIIRVDGDKLTFEARTAAGKLYDRFQLIKGIDGQRNRLIEGMPEIPQRLRKKNKKK